MCVSIKFLCCECYAIYASVSEADEVVWAGFGSSTVGTVS